MPFVSLAHFLNDNIYNNYKCSYKHLGSIFWKLVKLLQFLCN